MSGLKHLRPGLSLPTSARALAAWDTLVPSTQHSPMPEQLMFAVVYELGRRGFGEMGLFVWLTFHCYLRATEGVNLLVSDVILPGPTVPSTDAAIFLPYSKTGRNQSVMITSTHLVSLLRKQIRGKEPDHPVFDFSYWVVARAVKTILCDWGLGEQFSPLHSLRQGGATTDFQRGVPFPDIKVRGRWVLESTCRRYLQAAKALLLAVQLPPCILELGNLCKRRPQALMNYLAATLS